MPERFMEQPDMEINQEKKNPTQEWIKKFDETKGREIEGLPPKKERFSVLKPNEDYQTIAQNQEIISDSDVDDCCLFINPSQGKELRLVQAPHWRSIDSELKAKFKNESYYTANTKGCGLLKPTLQEIKFDDLSTWTRTLKKRESVDNYDNQVLGILNKFDLFGDRDGEIVKFSQDLVEKGLRCELFWSVVKLKKIPFHGELKTIEELRSIGVFPKRRDFNPFMAVRLLKINNRVAEAKEADNSYELFAKSFKVFNQETKDKNLQFPELDIKNPLHQKIYFQEFFKRMGNNLAILLNEDLIHYNLHSANITLAAEIADIGTMTQGNYDFPGENRLQKYNGVKKGHLKDMRDICYSLRILLEAAKENNLNLPEETELQKSFLDEFNTNLNQKQFKKNDTNFINSKKWMEHIFNAVIINHKNLPSLKNNEIENWPIDIG